MSFEDGQDWSRLVTTILRKKAIGVQLMCYDTSKPKGIISVGYQKVKVTILEITAKCKKKQKNMISQ